MKTLSQQEVSQVSGGDNIIAKIHRLEWNSYGLPLYNAGVFAVNLFLAEDKKIPYGKKAVV